MQEVGKMLLDSGVAAIKQEIIPQSPTAIGATVVGDGHDGESVFREGKDLAFLQKDYKLIDNKQLARTANWIKNKLHRTFTPDPDPFNSPALPREDQTVLTGLTLVRALQRLGVAQDIIDRCVEKVDKNKQAGVALGELYYELKKLQHRNENVFNAHLAKFLGNFLQNIVSGEVVPQLTPVLLEAGSTALTECALAGVTHGVSLGVSGIPKVISWNEVRKTRNKKNKQEKINEELMWNTHIFYMSMQTEVILRAYAEKFREEKAQEFTEYLDSVINCIGFVFNATIENPPLILLAKEAGYGLLDEKTSGDLVENARSLVENKQDFSHLSSRLSSIYEEVKKLDSATAYLENLLKQKIAESSKQGKPKLERSGASAYLLLSPHDPIEAHHIQQLRDIGKDRVSQENISPKYQEFKEDPLQTHSEKLESAMKNIQDLLLLLKQKKAVLEKELAVIQKMLKREEHSLSSSSAPSSMPLSPQTAATTQSDTASLSSPPTAPVYRQRVLPPLVLRATFSSGVSPRGIHSPQLAASPEPFSPLSPKERGLFAKGVLTSPTSVSPVTPVSPFSRSGFFSAIDRIKKSIKTPPSEDEIEYQFEKGIKEVKVDVTKAYNLIRGCQAIRFRRDSAAEDYFQQYSTCKHPRRYEIVEFSDSKKLMGLTDLQQGKLYVTWEKAGLTYRVVDPHGIPRTAQITTDEFNKLDPYYLERDSILSLILKITSVKGHTHAMQEQVHARLFKEINQQRMDLRYTMVITKQHIQKLRVKINVYQERIAELEKLEKPDPGYAAIIQHYSKVIQEYEDFVKKEHGDEQKSVPYLLSQLSKQLNSVRKLAKSLSCKIFYAENMDELFTDCHAFQAECTTFKLNANFILAKSIEADKRGLALCLEQEFLKIAQKIAMEFADFVFLKNPTGLAKITADQITTGFDSASWVTQQDLDMRILMTAPAGSGKDSRKDEQKEQSSSLTVSPKELGSTRKIRVQEVLSVTMLTSPKNLESTERRVPASGVVYFHS